MLFALLFALALLLTAYMKQEEVVFFKWDIAPLTLLLAAAFFALFFVLYHFKLWEKIPLGRLRILLVSFVLAGGTLWVFMARNQPFADAGLVYGYAQGFLNNDFSTIIENYLGHFPYQLSLALYYELVMRLVGPDCFYFLQMVNVGCAALAYLLVTWLAAELFESPAVQFFCCLLLFGCLPPILFVTFVYGTQIGLTLALLALFSALRFLRQRRRRWLLPMLAGMVGAIVIKQNYWIFAIAIIIFFVLDFIKKPSKTVAAAVAALLAGALLAPQAVYWSYEIRSGYEIEAGSPAILHIAMGMQEGERAPGWFNGYVLKEFDGVTKNYQAAKEQAGKDIAERLATFSKDPAYAARFYLYKTVSQWSDPTFASIQVSYFGGLNIPPLGYLPTSLFWGGLRAPVEGYMEIFLVLIYAGCFACFYFGKKQLSLRAMLPAVVVAGGFFFHLLWEAKSQYCWPYFVLMVPYAAAGLCCMAQKLEGRVAKRALRKRAPQQGGPGGSSLQSTAP
ncbi:MAG: hypothetical protein ACK5L3_11135 [Oscillospiraceae bacterium]